MAVRDRNLFAWQAYVITATFFCVALMLGMFFLWTSYSTLSKQYADAQSSQQNATTQFQQSDKRVNRLLSMMGIGEFTPKDLEEMSAEFASDEKLGPVEQEYSEAMKLFGPTVAPTDKNLLKLPKYLTDTVRRRNEAIQAALEREKQLNAQLAATIQSETKAREAAETAQKSAEDDLKKARQEHTLAVKRLNAEKEDEIKKFQANLGRVQQQVTTLRGQNRELQTKNDKQAVTIAKQMDIINQFKNPDFAAPQGEITSVANGGTLVWIDLGSADGLRAGVPFSVISSDEVNISEANTKAKLVVTEVVDLHLCRARVTESSSYRNPILTGDKVYSPVWRPGRKSSFVLVGKMDMNGDGKDDLDQVKELIRNSGGIIDDELDAKGNRNKGAGMSPNTTYMVLGTDVQVSDSATSAMQEQARQRFESYKSFMAEARQNGIPSISLDKLMGYLKTDGADRTIPLGNRIQSEDFRIRRLANPPASRGKVSDVFNTRRP